MTRLVLFFVAIALALGCDPHDKPDTRPFKLGSQVHATHGEGLARCTERTLRFGYLVREQEFGEPWKEPDTFVFFDVEKNNVHVAMFGSASKVDEAKERVEARLPIVKDVVSYCEKREGAESGAVADWLTVSYSKIDRSLKKGTGTITDIVMWEGGKFEFPSGAEAQDFVTWLGNKR